MKYARHATRLLTVAGILWSVAGLCAPARGGGSGPCYSAEIPAAIVLPDGSTHPPGRLRICVTRMHSPVEALHHTALDGRPIGMFRSRASGGEAGEGQPTTFFTFLRRHDGALVLLSMVSPDGRGGRTTFEMGAQRVSTSWTLGAEHAASDAGEVVRIAAR